MKKLAVCMLTLGLLSACGQPGSQGPAGQDAVVPSPSNPDVASLVVDENTYREGLGQAALTSGLSCSVQLLSSGQWLSSSSPGYQSAQGVVVALSGSTNYTFLLSSVINQADTAGNQPNLLIPSAIRPLFINQNYKISCSGQIVVTQTAYYNFDVNSDDGSILSVDGSQVVNNDGNHGMTDKSGTKYLRRGVHTISLLYAQTGSGNFGLIVQANGGLIDPGYLFH